MARTRLERGGDYNKLMTNNEKATKKMKKKVSGRPVHILELPEELLSDIISRLPLKTIFCAKVVCKPFLKIIKDPHFAVTHLANARDSSAALIVRDLELSFENFRPWMIEVDANPGRSSWSGDDHPGDQHIISMQSRCVSLKNDKCCFSRNNTIVISSCNGLVCLYSPAELKPQYCICNPVTGECLSLPPPKLASKRSRYIHSGFGFCATNAQYKVIHFMAPQGSSLPTTPNATTEVMVLTVGTTSWKNIGSGPRVRAGGSFDSLLSGCLHFITRSNEPSKLICSFDLAKDEFKAVPEPPHFVLDFVNDISWINVGVKGQCLCLCYTVIDLKFEVYVMKEYGIRESWVKDFVIDAQFYCMGTIEDLHLPIKFWNNGELLLISGSNNVTSYSPQRKTFRDIMPLEDGTLEAVAHVPSLVTIKSAVGGKRRRKVEKIILERPTLMSGAAAAAAAEEEEVADVSTKQSQIGSS